MFRSKYFWKHIFLILCAIITVIIIAFSLLKMYTRHGQKLEIPSYVNKNLTEAEELADDAGFEIVVNDSIFVVGKKGNIILSQNPVAGAFAKAGRTIYVTVTKFNADMISIGSLPALYGKSYELKKKVLQDGFEINTTVIGQVFDKGEAGMILKVLAGQDTIINENFIHDDYSIPRGSTLKFIISTKEGGETTVPEITCKTLSEARFITSAENLHVVSNGGQGDYITAQQPAYSPGAKMKRGDTIYVQLSEFKPDLCPSDEDDE